MATRTESDTMGKIEVAADRYWGGADAAIAAVLPDRRGALSAADDPCFGFVKKAAAMTNHELGQLPAKIAELTGLAFASASNKFAALAGGTSRWWRSTARSAPRRPRSTRSPTTSAGSRAARAAA